MNIKTIVKVMNFHALLRVDRSRREADRYAALEREVIHMIDLIQNNRNFILDKWILTAPENAPRLRIYIGSDLGFCGAVNASANQMLAEETGENTVITIGRKLHDGGNTVLHLDRDEWESRYDEVRAILADGVRHRRFSGIDLCYDHYYNMSHIEPVQRTIFPVELERDEYETYTEDFSVEGDDVNAIMEELVVTYLNYEVKIALVNAFASENILRQAATNDSMKKIEEIEAEQNWQRRRAANEKAARKVIDSYIRSRRRGK